MGGASAAGMAGASITPTATAQEDKVVDMVTEGGKYYFDPIGLHVEPGETVTFRIDSGTHSATAYAEGNGPAKETRIPDGAEAWDSGTITSGSFEYTFEAEGTHDYYCIPHKSLGMVGRIVVGEPGGPAEGSMPADGDVPQSDTIVEQGTVTYADFVSGGGPSTRNLLLGAAGLTGFTLIAIGTYILVNSEGEEYQVGSSEWREADK